ncbi:hypothetical protein JJC03_09190 [Flavobacterium oreochromis]|uniref:hypothetical protein n=1 Tax=Flavobacterium oreochromis TaxID=2906078 RepID=UPI001CE4FDB5|nr:hypothetical protein [Flavobacterium oreochromis]QYS85413.1 hypothetical protein JJC03_09190 [Flavobacterium oreochromis]
MYHPLVTLENVIATHHNTEATEAEINEFIRSQMIQTTMVTIESILDNHEDYDNSKDYSDVILSKASLFENAVGYAFAIKMIESFISSPRKNIHERDSKLTYQTLKIEIEGVKNDQGHFVAKGLTYKLQGAIAKAQALIFPKSITVESGNFW